MVMGHFGEARQLAANALFSLGDVPGWAMEHAVRHMAGVGELETRCGLGWKGAGVGSNNVGAIMAGSGWTGATFTYSDTHPTPNGDSTPYVAYFRAYPTLLDGWCDLARVMFTGRRADALTVAGRGDTYSVSEVLHTTGYYEGFGPTVHDRVRNHMLALRRSVLEADFALGSIVPRMLLEGAPVGMPRTVRFGDTGGDVRILQSELRLAADGIFGRVTDATLRSYQRGHALRIDGICGPKTWTELFSDNYIPEQESE